MYSGVKLFFVGYFYCGLVFLKVYGDVFLMIYLYILYIYIVF